MLMASLFWSWMTNMPRGPQEPPSFPAGAWLSLTCAWSSSFLPPPPCAAVQPGQKIICWCWQGILVLKTGHCFPKERLAACTGVQCLGDGLQGGFVPVASWAPGVPGCPSRQGWWSDEAQESLFLSVWLRVGVTPEVFIGFLQHSKNNIMNLILKPPPKLE